MASQSILQQNVTCSLYSLLESAKLSDYYDRFLAQGGDDIDQLCEATEDEFKEITKLVGMHTKPLHIRRLQKALLNFWSNKDRTDETSSSSLGPSWIETWNSGHNTQIKNDRMSVTKPTTTTVRLTTGNPDIEPEVEDTSPTPKRGRPPKYTKKTVKSEVFELKLPAMEAIIDWESLDDERKQLIRDHSQIYGRDSKKRKSTGLNSHEQIINEAAAQLCLRDPTLLVRRDELFTQARRIVRDSGFSFVHGHSRSKFADEAPSERMGDKDYPKSTNTSNRVILTKERLQEVNGLIQRLTERQVVLIKKRRELESSKQPTSDLQQELDNLTSQLTPLQAEQKNLQKKVRRSQRYYLSKEAQRRSILPDVNNSGQNIQAGGPMQQDMSSDNAQADEQQSVVVTEMLHNADQPNGQQSQGSSEDANGGRTLFIIPQQQLAESTSLDQTTINTLLNLANDQEKMNTDPQVLQNILCQIGLQPNLQITPQQLISQILTTTTADQTSMTREQQHYVAQQPDMTVVEQLSTPTSATELINHVTSSAQAVVAALQDTALQDQYVQQQDYQV